VLFPPSSLLDEAHTSVAVKQMQKRKSYCKKLAVTGLKIVCKKLAVTGFKIVLYLAFL
jgi:hypothetical protein